LAYDSRSGSPQARFTTATTTPSSIDPYWDAGLRARWRWRISAEGEVSTLVGIAPASRTCCRPRARSLQSYRYGCERVVRPSGRRGHRAAGMDRSTASAAPSLLSASDQGLLRSGAGTPRDLGADHRSAAGSVRPAPPPPRAAASPRVINPWGVEIRLLRSGCWRRLRLSSAE
jgi:alkylated DNA nucleotide flippase Atl1